MIREQLPLWDDPKQIILDKEKVDISTLRSSDERKNNFINLPKETYYIYKTGGINPYKVRLGKIFPFLKNDRTGKILNIRSSEDGKSATYPHWDIGNDGKGYKLYVHKIVALAFLELDQNLINIKNRVDHLDNDIFNYLPLNLEWVTIRENNLRRNKFVLNRKKEQK